MNSCVGKSEQSRKFSITEHLKTATTDIFSRTISILRNRSNKKNLKHNKIARMIFGTNTNKNDLVLSYEVTWPGGVTYPGHFALKP